MKADRFITVALACFSFTGIAIAQVDCSAYNGTKGPYPYSNLGTAQHSSGNHNWVNTTKGTCSYSGSGNAYASVPCYPHVTATSYSSGVDNGTTVPYWRSVSSQDAQGAADGAAGGSVTADAEGATAVASCAVFPCGAPTINLSGAGTGGGYSVTTNPANPLFADKFHYVNTCTGETLPQEQATVCEPQGNPPYPPDYGTNYWTWDYSSCSWDLVNYISPIIIDTANTGFKFTDPTQGQYVSFDMRGDGTLMKVSWPAPTSGNAWLALPDEIGTVKSGKQLFGNFTAHSDGGVPNHPNPNGFLALDWYDQPAQHGDGNLILDKRDAIWTKLKLWIDKHCYKQPDQPCQSLPGELHPLEEFGVTSISLVWDMKSWTDKIGNQYKFNAVLNPDAETKPVDDNGHLCCDLHQKSSKDGRMAYDVFVKYVN